MCLTSSITLFQICLPAAECLALLQPSILTSTYNTTVFMANCAGSQLRAGSVVNTITIPCFTLLWSLLAAMGLCYICHQHPLSAFAGLRCSTGAAKPIVYPLHQGLTHCMPYLCSCAHYVYAHCVSRTVFITDRLHFPILQHVPAKWNTRAVLLPARLPHLHYKITIELIQVNIF